ncbi:NPH3 family [Musa troglodytarum]|uniref:NPH3 family n=1 Tax=Musa troglodytarum TaxID=320322 RepID=A0A9E7KFP7_9LILI|nr:NPH3 family [Musa troglodytarum]
MLGAHQETPPPPSSPIPRKEHLLSTAMKRTSEWIYSGGPDRHRCEGRRIKLSFAQVSAGLKMWIHPKDGIGSQSPQHLSDRNPDVPGGAEAFELVMKYCYGINFEITAENIAMLRCVAEYLEMTEDYTVGNLVSRAEAYLEEVALQSLSAAVTVLHKSEELLPVSEKVKLVSRCIDAVAYMACNDSQLRSSSRTDNYQEGSLRRRSRMRSLIGGQRS